MNILVERITSALREARRAKGLSQRQLAERVGITQAQISRIEKALVDPRLSTIVELGRSLELELMLVPRQLVPTVRALERQQAGEEAAPLYRLEEGND